MQIYASVYFPELDVNVLYPCFCLFVSIDQVGVQMKLTDTFFLTNSMIGMYMYMRFLYLFTSSLMLK